MIHLYKAQVLSYVEYRTVAIYHACDTHLVHIDRMQTRFLKELDVSPEQALVEFHLAPLSTRRDIAMLGMVHRAALGKGPSQLHQFFAVLMCSAGGRPGLEFVHTIVSSESTVQGVTRSCLHGLHWG